jgi:hypothetical protein
MPGYSSEDHTKFDSKAGQTVQGMSTAEMAQQMRGTDPGSSTARNWNDIFRQLDNSSHGGDQFQLCVVQSGEQAQVT